MLSCEDILLTNSKVGWSRVLFHKHFLFESSILPKITVVLPLKVIVQLRVENSEFELWQKSDDPCSFFPSNSGRKVYCFVGPHDENAYRAIRLQAEFEPQIIAYWNASVSTH